MRITLETDTGITYLIKRRDGHQFLAAVKISEDFDPKAVWKQGHWAVWPKGHIEARQYFPNLQDALNVVIAGWWCAEAVV